MQQTIFYSWQSDLPNNTNRSFIETCIEEAIEELKSSEVLKVEPVIDRDTVGVAGSPDIGLTIFSKVSKAAVFICDVSLIHKEGKGWFTPNPNVLIELGYALKTMGASRIIMVMNTAFGKPDDLPFDLKLKRVLTYEFPKDGDKTAAKKILKGKLAEAVKTVLLETQELAAEVTVNDPATLAIEAIKNKRPDTNRAIHTYMKWLASELQKIDPKLSQEAELDEALFQSVDKSVTLVKTFDNVANAISALDASDAANTLVSDFEHILTLYFLPVGFSGGSRRIDFDLYKFVGHEIFVILIAYLIKDGRWALIREVLKNKIHVENHPSGSPDTLPYTAIVDFVALFDEVRKKRLATDRGSRTSIHADILNERHGNMPLSENLTWHEFMDADFFLFFHSLATNQEDEYHSWWPRTWVYLGGRVPRFLTEGYSQRGAKNLITGLDLKELKELRPVIQKAITKYHEGMRNTSGFISDPFRSFDINKIPEN